MLFLVEYIVGDVSYKDIITALTPADAAATIKEWMPTASILDVRRR